MNPAALPALVWFSQRTALSLAGAAAGWLLSGLSMAPLVNGLLPALTAGTTLLPLRPGARLGLVLQFSGLLLLLASALRSLGPSPLLPLLASVLMGVGRTVSLLPLHRWLLASRGLTLALLQRLGDGGALVGSLLTALLYPLLRNTSPQFAVAALLLLPTLRVAIAAGPGERAVMPRAPATAGGIDPRAGFQGLLFGALFALLPLWVRTIGGGDCIDFGLVLTAYGLGRIVALPAQLPPWSLYVAMAVVLQVTSWLPGWGATALFAPLGALAAGTDAILATSTDKGTDTAERLTWIDRSLAAGSLVGSLAMGAAAQEVGLPQARVLIVILFLLAAPLLPRHPPATTA